MPLDYPDNTPPALLDWVRGALFDSARVACVVEPFDCQGVPAQPGDWLTEFDDVLGVLWRPDGPGRLVTVARNDGMPPESLMLGE